MTDSHIRSEVDDGIAAITIDRPEKRDAMTYAVLADFTDAVWRAADDEAARAVSITGAAGAFCAGTDLSELDDTPEDERYLEASPFAVARTKRLVYQAMAAEVAAHVAETGRLLQERFHAEDHAEGVASFLERRPARFTGR